MITAYHENEVTKFSDLAMLYTQHANQMGVIFGTPFKLLRIVSDASWKPRGGPQRAFLSTVRRNRISTDPHPR